VGKMKKSHSRSSGPIWMSPFWRQDSRKSFRSAQGECPNREEQDFVPVVPDLPRRVDLSGRVSGTAPPQASFDRPERMTATRGTHAAMTADVLRIP
jgi:hypothetical protein